MAYKRSNTVPCPVTNNDECGESYCLDGGCFLRDKMGQPEKLHEIKRMDFDDQRGAVNQTTWWFRKPSWLTVTYGQWLSGSIAALLVWTFFYTAPDTVFRLILALYLANRAFDYMVRITKDHE